MIVEPLFPTADPAPVVEPLATVPPGGDAASNSRAALRFELRSAPLDGSSRRLPNDSVVRGEASC